MATTKKMNKKHLRSNAVSLFGDVFIYAFLILLCLLILYPVWNQVVIAFNDGRDTARGGLTLWPRKFTTANFELVFKDQRIFKSFWVSVARTLVGTVGKIAVTMTMAYGMSRKDLMGRNFYMILCVITMYFGGGLIPSFILIRDLGLYDSFWVMIIPGLMSVWDMIIFRTFILALPSDLSDAARIDGCHNWGIYLRIIIPLSKPVLATIGLFTAVEHWNDWFAPSIYINNPDLMPIQTKLQEILNASIMTEQMSQLDPNSLQFITKQSSITAKSLQAATMVVSTLPILLVYPFVQKYFVQGMLIGSIKG